MVARRRVYELRRDAHAVAGLADAALEDVAHSQLAADPFRVDRPALIDEGGVTGDHRERAPGSERGNDVFGEAIREVLLLGIATHVGKGKHDDRGFLGRWRGVGILAGRFCRRPLRRDGDPVHPDWLGDVLDLLLAQVLEAHLDLAFDVVEYSARHADAAGLG